MADLIGSSIFNSVDTYKIIDNSIYDNNLNDVGEWEKENNFKRIKFVGGLPYCHNTRIDRDILFNCLHCTAGAKELSGSLLARSNQ
jgi:hypothetical protein